MADNTPNLPAGTPSASGDYSSRLPPGNQANRARCNPRKKLSGSICRQSQRPRPRSRFRRLRRFMPPPPARARLAPRLPQLPPVAAPARGAKAAAPAAARRPRKDQPPRLSPAAAPAPARPPRPSFMVADSTWWTRSWRLQPPSWLLPFSCAFIMLAS